MLLSCASVGGMALDSTDQAERRQRAQLSASKSWSIKATNGASAANKIL